MASATAPAPKASTDELLLLLAEKGEVTLPELAAKVGEAALSLAWNRGEIEFGRTKYVVTGNPATAVTTHNGVHLPPPTVVVESGDEWTGPKQRWHGPYSAVASEKLPVCPRYQKYQLEVCVNKEKDVWEWLEAGVDPAERDTRYARRTIGRPEAEKLFTLRARLTERGAAALQG